MAKPVIDDMAVSKAKDIARQALEGNYDILLAVRDLYDLRNRLPPIPSETLDAIVGIGSEVGDLPLGDERQYWAADALREQDEMAADYRKRVSTLVGEVLRELLAALHKASQRPRLVR